MGYNLIITERTEKLLDNHIHYLLFRLKNKQAAGHLLDCVENIYSRLEDNPFQFPSCRDSYLDMKGYREAVFPDMEYLIIYKVDEKKNTVYVLGVFHSLENYQNKL